MGGWGYVDVFQPESVDWQGVDWFGMRNELRCVLGLCMAPFTCYRLSLIEWQPGIVECSLRDVRGRTWKFIEKVPVVSLEDLWSDSEYPRRGATACKVVGRDFDSSGRQIVMIQTIESVEGNPVFEVFADQLEEDGSGTDL